MKVIQPNCRVQFTAQDVDFIAAALGKGSGEREFLIQLLADAASRDLLLDDPRLFQRLLEDRSCLKVSTHFYFYVLVRRVLKESGIEQREVADYVAEMLAEFSFAQRLRCAVPGQDNPCEYFFEMLAALQRADDRTNFLIRAHIGNYSLFLAGVFPDRVRWRAEKRGCPDLSYYEQLGRTSFRVASDHRIARRCELADIYATLSARFRQTREALNEITERLFSLGDDSGRFDEPLRKIITES